MKPVGRRKVVGVMGGADVPADVASTAEELGRRIARAGWVLLTGGRPAGVMEAASRGARSEGGLVVGVLPDADPDQANKYVDVAIATAQSDARNLVNVLSCDVVVACFGGAGTISEVALAVKNRRPLVLLDFDPGKWLEPHMQYGRIRRVSTVGQAIQIIEGFVAGA